MAVSELSQQLGLLHAGSAKLQELFDVDAEAAEPELVWEQDVTSSGKDASFNLSQKSKDSK